jgi:hypothetical protein
MGAHTIETADWLHRRNLSRVLEQAFGPDSVLFVTFYGGSDMTMNGRLTRSSLAQTMPVHADPLNFTNASFRGVNQVTFSYRTNTDSAYYFFGRLSAGRFADG